MRVPSSWEGECISAASTPLGRQNEELSSAGSGQAEVGGITSGTLELGNQDVWLNFTQKPLTSRRQLQPGGDAAVPHVVLPP